MSSTLLTEDTGVPFHQLQAEQIHMFRSAWKEAGDEREPRVSVSRSIFPIVNSTDRAYFGAESRSEDQVGFIDGGTARFGKTYAGEVDQLVKELAGDEAIAAADTLLLTIPNQLGVDYNAHLLDSIIRYVAPELGWRDADRRAASRAVVARQPEMLAGTSRPSGKPTEPDDRGGSSGTEIAIDDQSCESRVAQIVRHIAACRDPLTSVLA